MPLAAPLLGLARGFLLPSAEVCLYQHINSECRGAPSAASTLLLDCPPSPAALSAGTALHSSIHSHHAPLRPCWRPLT